MRFELALKTCSSAETTSKHTQLAHRRSHNNFRHFICGRVGRINANKVWCIFFVLPLVPSAERTLIFISSPQETTITHAKRAAARPETED